MLRRNIRDYYQLFSPSQEQKDAVLNYLLENRSKSTDIQGKRWRAKGQWGSWTVILLLLAVVLVAGYRVADQHGLVDFSKQKISELSAYIQEQLTPPPTQESVDPNAPTEVVTPEIYASVVARYITAIQEDWEPIRCEEEDISFLVSLVDNPEDLGYAVMDLDENGIRELLITDGNVIYDLYTWADQELVHVISGAERNSFRLTQSGAILNTGSSGASSTVYTFYRYSGGYMIIDQMVVFDSQKDPEKPWFRGFSMDNLESITEVAARQILDSYRKVSIPCAPVTQYE